MCTRILERISCDGANGARQHGRLILTNTEHPREFHLWNLCCYWCSFLAVAVVIISFSLNYFFFFSIRHRTQKTTSIEVYRNTRTAMKPKCSKCHRFYCARVQLQCYVERFGSICSIAFLSVIHNVHACDFFFRHIFILSFFSIFSYCVTHTECVKCVVFGVSWLLLDACKKLFIFVRIHCEWR